MGYLVVGMVLGVPGEHEDNLRRRTNCGDLGLQVPVQDFPLVQLPPPEVLASSVQARAAQCVVGLVQLLRRSVPRFWEANWDILSLPDFNQDRYSLTTEAIIFLTGVVKFVELVMHGSFPHDAYLAWVGGPSLSQGRGELSLSVGSKPVPD